jgi:hypothetical protein
MEHAELRTALQRLLDERAILGGAARGARGGRRRTTDVTAGRRRRYSAATRSLSHVRTPRPQASCARRAEMEALRASLPRPHLAARGSRAGCSCARPAAAARAPAVACSAASPQSHGAAVARQSAAPSRRDVLAAGIALLSLAPPLARADEEAAVQVRGTRLMRAPACSLRRGLFWLGTCPPYRNRFLSRRAFQEAADALAPAAPTAVVEVPAAPAPAPAPAGAASFTQLRDDTLAYSFEYPVTTGEGRQLSWVATREPMRCAIVGAAPPPARRGSRAPGPHAATRLLRRCPLTRGSASCVRCVPALAFGGCGASLASAAGQLQGPADAHRRGGPASAGPGCATIAGGARKTRSLTALVRAQRRLARRRRGRRGRLWVRCWLTAPRGA